MNLAKALTSVATHLAAIACLSIPLAAHAQTLPPEIAASKVVRAALNTGYAPLETKDPATNQPVGFDIDLAAAMAKVLGVTIEYQDGSFEQMTPSLQSSRVDMIMSGFYDIPRRRPFFDFIDYLRAGGQFYALKSNATIKVATDLCGQTVTTGRGTSYPDSIKRWSDKNCVEAGKPPITIITQTDFAQSLSVIQLRLLHYLPQDQHAALEGGDSRAHSDAGGFTLLQQDDVGGLEIRGKSGEWILIPPVENSFVVNIGDSMKMWTNHRFASTLHRVVNSYGRDRYSIGVFANPNYDTVITPLPTCVDAAHPPKFEQMHIGEALLFLYSRIWPSLGGGSVASGY